MIRPSEIGFQLNEIIRVLKRDSSDFKKEIKEYDDPKLAYAVQRFTIAAEALDKCVVIIEDAKKRLK